MNAPATRAWAWTAMALTAAAQAGSLAPWLWSGSAARNSFQALQSAQRLGIEELTPYRVIWFLLPVVLVTGALLLAAGRRRAGLATAFVVALALLVGAWQVDRLGVGVGWGVPATAALAVPSMLAAGTGLAWPRRR